MNRRRSIDTFIQVSFDRNTVAGDKVEFGIRNSECRPILNQAGEKINEGFGGTKSGVQTVTFGGPTVQGEDQ